MKQSRRSFLQSAGTTGVVAAFGNTVSATGQSSTKEGVRRFHHVQIDVFTSRRLQGNPLAVFTDARGLSNEEMQGLARETNLQETTFIFRRDPAIEREQGVKVRIYAPEEEIPFGGHPTLGTAMVLRNLRVAQAHPGAARQDVSEVLLDLQVGKVPVNFREEALGSVFGEMHQVRPVFGPVHDHETVAKLLDLNPSDLVADLPIQTISTGLPFAIVPIKQLSTLQQGSAEFRVSETLRHF